MREHFISTWALVVDLKSIIANQSETNLLNSQRAKYALDNYSFPVESIIQHVNGTVIDKINANHLLNMDSTADQIENTGTELFIRRYVSFLEQSLQQ